MLGTLSLMRMVGVSKPKMTKHTWKSGRIGLELASVFRVLVFVQVLLHIPQADLGLKGPCCSLLNTGIPGLHYQKQLCLCVQC